jgi:hypothetical protein
LRRGTRILSLKLKWVRLWSAAWLGTASLAASTAPAVGSGPFAALRPFIDQHCANCHDDVEQEGGLDLTSVSTDLSQRAAFDRWVKVHDRVAEREMPPKRKVGPLPEERDAFTEALAEALTTADRARVAPEGRATRRRLNRHEYENTLRDILSLPNLAVKHFLPEDGEAHHFNKSGEALDVSHVQMGRYLAAADFALRQAIVPQALRPEITLRRYYARDQTGFSRPMKFNPRIRRPFPVLGTEAQPDVLAGTSPWTVGASDPARRELEAVGVVVSTYEPTELRFTEFQAPVAGRYRLRFLAYPIWVNHISDPTGKVPDFRAIDFTQITAGRRLEPVTLYADIQKTLRKLGSFDAQLETNIAELEVWLNAGETIRPDAARLFRARGPDFRNPLQEPDGMPGVAFRWMEVEGPLIDEWPSAGHRVLFGDLPLAGGNGASPSPVDIVSTNPERDAAKLLRAFVERTYRRPVTHEESMRFLPLISDALKAGGSFKEAMITGYTAVLCSPGFLYTDEAAGWLDDHALAARLAYFLWNGPPDDTLRALASRGELHNPEVLRLQTDRLLGDPRSRRFVNAFLDYWLDLRKIAATTPDATLYPDYQLDDWLVESIVEETQLFFAELLRRNASVKAVVASDFAMLNERLARHYSLPPIEGVAFRPVAIPPDSIRGGLITHASVLKVTANGTTTSPVLRGAWIMERILGLPPPPPPPTGVPAVEPDTRGATTMREQLERHRSDVSCSACHRKIDPPGFALENFDPMGAWRDRYRSLGAGEPVTGVGHSAQIFKFALGPSVEGSGELPDGRKFRDIRELRQLLLDDAEQLARNLVQELIIYATGAPVGFADRPVVADILARSKVDDYGVRTLIHEIVQSELFQCK